MQSNSLLIRLIIIVNKWPAMFTQDELNQLYRYALSLSAQEDVAYDLLQAALERYLKKSPVAEKSLAYLKIIIRNLYIDLQRRSKTLPMVSIESDEVVHIEPVDISLLDDLLINEQAVEQLTAMLSSEENELLYLWAVEEYTVDEISVMFHKPRGTVLSKLHRLKQRIRKQVEELEFTETEMRAGVDV